MKESRQVSHSKIILVIFAFSGMTALIYEIVWIRPLALVFGTTVYATSIIIASFLLGLALGSWIAGKYSDRMNQPLKIYGFIELGVGFYGILLLPIFSVLPYLYIDIYNATFQNYSLFSVLQFMLAFAIILVPTTLMGTTLPLVMRSYSDSFGRIGKDLGRLYSVNNIGAVAGTLAAGFILLPVLGIKQSIMTAALINFGLSILVLLLAKTQLKVLLTTGTIIAIILVFAFFATYDFKALDFGAYMYAFPGLGTTYLNSFLGEEQVKFYKESMYSTVSITSIEGVNVLKINGKTQCSTDYFDEENKIGLAKVPYDLFEENYAKPSNALNIGLGCGATARWLADRVKTTTVEIDPAVVEAASFFNDKTNQTLIIDDARNWLMRNDEKFNIIISEPSDPFANQGYLFTYEYFSLLHDRLNKNRLVSVWVPTYIMSLDDFYTFYNTFHLVFPHVYLYANNTYAPEITFIGSDRILKVSGMKDLIELDNKSIPNDNLYNTDDRPLIEFSTAMNLYRHNSTEIQTKIQEWENLEYGYQH